jgi:hypothetical protein
LGIRGKYHDRLHELENHYAVEVSKLEGQMMRAEDGLAWMIRQKEMDQKRLREMRLLVSTKSSVTSWFGDKEDKNWKQYEIEWKDLEKEEKKVKHAVGIEVLRIIPVTKLLAKLPELEAARDSWKGQTELFDIWTEVAKQQGQLLDDRYATQTCELYKDFDARCRMLQERFEKRYDHMEWEKNARVANAMAVCQAAKEKFEALITKTEEEFVTLRKKSEWAATEMGALRIEIANLEDEACALPAGYIAARFSG